MNNRLTIMPINSVIAGLFCLAAVVAIWPVSKLTPPELPSAETSDATLTEQKATFNAAPFVARFNLSSLERKPIEREPTPVVKVDPLESLKAYRLIGVTVSDARAIAILANGEEPINAIVGDRIAGFEITAINPRNVSLQKEGVTATLTMPNPA